MKVEERSMTIEEFEASSGNVEKTFRRWLKEGLGEYVVDFALGYRKAWLAAKKKGLA